MFASGRSHNTLRFNEKRRSTGEICRHKDSIPTDYLFFQDFNIWKVFPFESSIF